MVGWCVSYMLACGVRRVGQVRSTTGVTHVSGAGPIAGQTELWRLVEGEMASLKPSPDVVCEAAHERRFDPGRLKSGGSW